MFSSEFVSPVFSIEADGAGKSAIANPVTGQVWLAYSVGASRISIRRVAHSGPNDPRIDVRGADGVQRFDVRLAVNPVNGNVLAVWQESALRAHGTPATVLSGQIWDKSGSALTAASRYTDAETQAAAAFDVAATKDVFVIVENNAERAAPYTLHNFALAVDPLGAVVADWTPLDNMTVNGSVVPPNRVSVSTNTQRETVGLTWDAQVPANNIYFQEITATPGVQLTVSKNGNGGGVVSSAPGKIVCGSVCTDFFDPATVAVAAAADDVVRADV